MVSFLLFLSNCLRSDGKPSDPDSLVHFPLYLAYHYKGTWGFDLNRIFIRYSNSCRQNTRTWLTKLQGFEEFCRPLHLGFKFATLEVGVFCLTTWYFEFFLLTWMMWFLRLWLIICASSDLVFIFCPAGCRLNRIWNRVLVCLIIQFWAIKFLINIDQRSNVNYSWSLRTK